MSFKINEKSSIVVAIPVLKKPVILGLEGRNLRPEIRLLQITENVRVRLQSACSRGTIKFSVGMSDPSPR